MAASPLRENKFLAAFIIFWVVMTIDHACVLYWFGMPLKAAMADSAISNILLLILSLLVINMLRFYMPRGEQHVNIFALCLILSLVWIFTLRWLLKISVGSFTAGYSTVLQQSIPIRFSIGFLLLGCITLVSILWFSQKEQKENETRKADAEKLAREAELFKLRQQLQPHFLFNSLNSINALIGTRPEEARKMVQQLSDFLRGTIKKEETQWVTLQEELQYLQLYLDIEKVRFGNRLSTEINVADEALQMKLPALLLQPIVENAIKFGLYDTTGDTVIRIDASVENHHLMIRVQNPFDPDTASPHHKGTGFGLQSIQRRLYLHFARTDLLTTAANETIFNTIVKIPQVKS
jgi:two-component system, LytTR family, sensor kinase